MTDTTEHALAQLTTAVSDQTSAVAAQQLQVNNTVIAFGLTTNKVDTELNLVDNTADVDKPISSLQQQAIDSMQPTLVSGANISTVNGESLLSGTPLVIARGQVEIPILAYEDRDELRTPVVPIPLAGDVVTIPHLGQLQFNSTLEYLDDDEMVYQAVSPADGVTPIGQWVLTLPAYEWTEAQKMFEHAVMWEWMEDSDLRHVERHA
jgi:hypothetical protein